MNADIKISHQTLGKEGNMGTKYENMFNDDVDLWIIRIPIRSGREAVTV
jgi:hypothetical protein